MWLGQDQAATGSRRAGVGQGARTGHHRYKQVRGTAVGDGLRPEKTGHQPTPHRQGRAGWGAGPWRTGVTRVQARTPVQGGAGAAQGQRRGHTQPWAPAGKCPAPQHGAEGAGSSCVTGNAVWAPGDSAGEERHFRKNKSGDKGTVCEDTGLHTAVG